MRLLPGGANTFSDLAPSYGVASGAEFGGGSAPYAHLTYHGASALTAYWEPILIPSAYATQSHVVNVWVRAPSGAATGNLAFQMGVKRFTSGDAFPAAQATYITIANHAIPTAGVLTVASGYFADLFQPGYFHELSLRRLPTANISPTMPVEVLGLTVDQLTQSPNGTPLYFAQTSVAGGDTVSNNDTEQTFTAKPNAFAANHLTVGKLLRIQARGVYGTDAVTPGTVTLKVKLGSTILASTDAITNVAALTNRGWTLDLHAVVTTGGASGVVESQGYAELSTALGAASIADMENTAGVSVDLTQSLQITITVQFSVADADNTITLRQFIVEVLG